MTDFSPPPDFCGPPVDFADPLPDTGGAQSGRGTQIRIRPRSAIGAIFQFIQGLFLVVVATLIAIYVPWILDFSVVGWVVLGAFTIIGTTQIVMAVLYLSGVIGPRGRPRRGGFTISPPWPVADGWEGPRVPADDRGAIADWGPPAPTGSEMPGTDVNGNPD
jgi:hypothetical protein